MAHTAYRQHQAYKDRIRERDNYTCQLCGEEGWQVDHIIPFAISHDSSEENLRVLCRKCNTDTRRPRKDARMPYDEWIEWVKSQL